MKCEECSRLHRAYTERLSAYIESVNGLIGVFGCSESDFTLVSSAVNRARAQVRLSFSDLQSHRTTHRGGKSELLERRNPWPLSLIGDPPPLLRSRA
jgi:hypothetical protein